MLLKDGYFHPSVCLCPGMNDVVRRLLFMFSCAVFATFPPHCPQVIRKKKTGEEDNGDVDGERRSSKKRSRSRSRDRDRDRSVLIRTWLVSVDVRSCVGVRYYLVTGGKKFCWLKVYFDKGFAVSVKHL